LAININDIFDTFWKLFDIASGGSQPDITKVLDSIVKSDRSKLDQYFTNAVDQIAFDTQDWKRLREFFIDFFTAHRAQITNSLGVSDPHFLSNDDLDELFRSFGYTESTRLKDFDDNPLESKVQLFLDLVNLYKIKGTPRSILEILQYYGIPELDIFEFWLQKEDTSTLTFKGDVITGTTLNPSSVYLPYDLLTQGDPHWMMTENQILNLDAINKISLPSKSPYFAVQPVVEVGIENSILVRAVQDQYFEWEASGTPKVLPEQNAEISILGVTASLLELYLLTLYSFQKDYEVGSDIERFACYDGTNTSAVDIIAEYDAILAPPITRDSKDAKWQQYLNTFTRLRDRHFLYGQGDNAAGTILNIINPDLITELEALTSDNTTVLQSLLKDLGVWVRNNIGFGFVNLGYIFFGLNELFKDLKPVINFFKPYRARLVVLEMFQFRNILSDSIPIDDSIADFTIDFEINDFMTANGSPCCDPDTSATICIDSTSGSFYSRDTYDCGSYHDIGAVEDFSSFTMVIDQYLCDSFRCPPGCPTDNTGQSSYSYEGICDRMSGLPPSNFDGTSAMIITPDSTSCLDYSAMTCENVPIVFSEEVTNTLEKIEDLTIGSESITVVFGEPLSSSFYILNVNLFNDVDGAGSSFYGIVVSEKTNESFTVTFSGPLDSVNYKLAWNINPDATFVGVDALTYNQNTHRVNFGYPLNNSNYAIGTATSNTVDVNPSIYNFVITNKDVNGFDILLSSPIDSTNYNLEWNVYDSTSFIPNGLIPIPFGSTVQEVDIENQTDDMYSLALSIVNTTDASTSIYSYIVTQKNTNDFTVRYSGPIDSSNYYLSWAITYRTEEEYLYRQESGFRLFDTMGRFDCTHGFDMVEITMEQVSQVGVIIQENEGWLLQEDAVITSDDDYGLLLD
jgi:methionine-rich copper-binding protein CopC